MSTIRLLIRPALFTAGICGTCFCGAAIAQHNNRKSHFTFNQRRRPIVGFEEWVQQRRTSVGKDFMEVRRKINTWKNKLSTGEKIALGATLVNFAVLCAWHVKRFQPIMVKFFLSQTSTTKIRLSPMILSCFSHANAIHFAFNMYALWSFSRVATSSLGPEQLIGFYISAGTISSLTSIAYKLLTKRTTSSLGASGAVLAVVAYVCVKKPDSELLLFFIPIAAGTAIKGLMLFDSIGMMVKWSVMDHAAHLGGTLFGFWYALHGERFFHRHKGKVVEKWLKFRSKYD